MNRTRNHDRLMERETGAKPNCMVPWYVLASYAYYRLDQPVISDMAFDRLARRLLIDWKQVEHPHKRLISEDALRAGTMLLSEDEYPSVAKGAARALLADLRGQEDACGMSPLERICRSLLGF